MASGRLAVRWVLSLVVACAALALPAPGFTDPQGWSDDLRLTWTQPIARMSYNNANSVACDIFGNVHVVWTEEGDFYWYPYYVCRRAGGTDWTQPLCLSGDLCFSFYPAVACDPWGNVHVVWCNYDMGPDIYYRKYDGASWGPIQRLTNDGYESWSPSIAADGTGRVHVAWYDLRDGNEEIYYKQFDGVTWGPDERLTSAAKISWYPAIAADTEGKVHVVWGDFRGSIWRIWYKRLDEASWSPDTALTVGSADHPAIAVGGDDTVHLVWVDQRNANHEIYYKRLDASGWGGDLRLTATPGYSYNPSVAVDVEGNVHVAWYDNSDGDEEIYYRMCDGAGWGPIERLTNANGMSQFPSIATDDRGSVHLAWMDQRDGNIELYYKQRYDPASGLSVPDMPVGAPCLVRVSPNPARSEVRLDFWQASAGPTSLVVADIAGRVVWRDEAALVSPGWHSVTWTCRDSGGLAVAPGIYLTRIQAGTGISRVKLVLTR